jgi:hypothetical protein
MISSFASKFKEMLNDVVLWRAAMSKNVSCPPELTMDSLDEHRRWQASVSKPIS